MSGPPNTKSSAKEGRTLIWYGVVVGVMVGLGLFGLAWREAVNPIPPRPTPTETAAPSPTPTAMAFPVHS
jgi:hypothetical protein